LAALEAIRSVAPAAKVVMVSAVNQKEKLKRCIELGAIDFIVKPFDPDELMRFLEVQKQSPA
jgi:two-component system chemotaxis response regulator CheY